MNCIKTESLTWFRKTNIVIRSFRVIFSEFPKISMFFFTNGTTYCSYIDRRVLLFLTEIYQHVCVSENNSFERRLVFNLVYAYRRKTKKKKKTRRGFIAFLRLSDDKSKKRTVKISFTVDTRRVKEETYPTIGTKIRNLILRKINDLEK